MYFNKITNKKINEIDDEQEIKIKKNIILDANNIVKFNLNSLLRKKETWLIMILFAFFAIILVTIFVPYQMSGGVLLLTFETLPLFLFVGWTGYVLRKTTTYKNMEIQGVHKNTFYISQLITLFIMANIMSVVFLSFLWFLGMNSVLLHDWGFSSGSREAVNIFNYGAWINWIYITQLNFILVFSIYFMFHSIIKKQNTYYVLVIIIYIFGVIFGGVLNNFFQLPFGSYFQYGDEGVNSVVDYDNQTIYVLKDEWLDTTYQYYIDYNYFSRGLMPTSMFIPSLFYPFYGLGQFATSAGSRFADAYLYWKPGFEIYVVNDFSEIGTNLEPWGLCNPNISWNIFYDFNFSEEGWKWSAVLLQPYPWILASFIIGKFTSIEKINKN
ncbi:MAG: hypothetical protein TYPL_1690 [Candidatus Tyloplasma litorale]|nr:MAG: hypothetical protein TYPL_1690 [Mycoplasmatales bacterium]